MRIPSLPTSVDRLPWPLLLHDALALQCMALPPLFQTARQHIAALSGSRALLCSRPSGAGTCACKRWRRQRCKYLAQLSLERCAHAPCIVQREHRSRPLHTKGKALRFFLRSLTLACWFSHSAVYVSLMAQGRTLSRTGCHRAASLAGAAWRPPQNVADKAHFAHWLVAN